MLSKVRIIKPNSWEQLKEMFFGLSLGWIFRGQRESVWGLSSSLERLSSNLPRAAIEAPIVRQFKSRIHHYAGYESGATSLLGILSLMQHHGAPTRLIDWTESAYVATFFAIEDANDKNSTCAVWAIDESWCKSKSVHLLKESKSAPDEYKELSIHTDFSLDENLKIVFANHEQFLMPLKPKALNERIVAQQGLFLAQGNIYNTFFDNLLALGDEEVKLKVIKFQIPNLWRAKILHDLRQMNIGPDSLFPGLDGFARSLKLRFSALDEGGVSDEVAEVAMKYHFFP